MGIFDKIRARREEKQAKKNVSWENPAQPVKPASTRGYKQGGYDAGEGTGSHNPNKGSKIIGIPENEVQPKRQQSQVNKIEPKKVTKIDAPKSKAPEVKRNPQKPPVKADTRSPRQKREDEFNAKKKKSTITKDYSKKTDVSSTPVTSDDKEGQARIAAGNKRAIANRKAKGAAKSGDDYQYEDKNGKMLTFKKP